MSNVILKALKNTAEAGKVAVRVGGQALAIQDNAWEAIKDASPYIREISEGTVAEAFDHDRCVAANKASYVYIKDKINGAITAAPVKKAPVRRKTVKK